MWRLKKPKLIEKRLLVAWGTGCEVDKMGEVGQKVQTSSYKIITSENVMYSMVTIVNNNVLCI